jgi:hypothetical protein
MFNKEKSAIEILYIYFVKENDDAESEEEAKGKFIANANGEKKIYNTYLL